MSTRTPASERLNAYIAKLTNDQLVTALLAIDSVAKPDQYERLVRARMLDEAEERWPAAGDAVGAAFEAWDAAIVRGEEPADVDYVAVLLAAIPHA